MIHKYNLNNHFIVLDVESGAIHCLDELSYKILDFEKDFLSEKGIENIKKQLNSFSENEIDESISELTELYNEGILFSEDIDEKELNNLYNDAPVKALCLNIAHDCNLRCEYCFASKGDFGTGRKLMSLEIGKAAIDFVIKKSNNRKNIEVDFFGGEPLMNFEVVKGIVKYARSIEKQHNKNFRFTITTNGLLIDDDKIDFINENMSNVVLSLDGRKEVNDNVRKRVDGSGCFDTILPKFKHLVEKRNNQNYYIRGTFTKFNLDFAKDVEEIYNLGYNQISVEPVVSEEKYPWALTKADLPKILEEYEKLAKMIIDYRKSGKYFNFFHFMIDLEDGPCIIKRLKGCGCGNEYLAVTPEGNIYPCHQFVGNDMYNMGNVLTDEIDNEIRNNFIKTSVLNKKDCTKCWAKYFCSGGCNANNYAFNNDILKPYEISCEMERKRIECAIMIKAELQ